MTASTSRSEKIRYSLSSSLNSVPEYLEYRTRAPCSISGGTRSPVSSNLPGHGYDGAFLWLLFCGIRQYDAASGDCFAVCGQHDDAVAKGF